MPILVDSLTGLMIDSGLLSEGGIGSPGQIFRISLFLFSLSLLKSNHIRVIFVFGMGYCILLEIFWNLQYQSFPGFVLSISQAIKVLSIIVSIVLVTHFLRCNNPESIIWLRAFINVNVFFVSLVLFVCFFFGLGFSSYKDGGVGTSGFFSGANALGLSHGVLILIGLGINRRNLFNIIFFVFCASSLLCIGTKTSAVFFLCISFISLVRHKALLTILLFSFVVFLAYESLPTIELAQYQVVLGRIQNSELGLLRILLGDRYVNFSDGLLFVLENDLAWVKVIFGGGGYLSYQNPSLTVGYDIIEMDLADVFFMYGLMGLFLLLLFFTLLIYMSRFSLPLFLAATLLVFHSLFAGHVVFNGMSSLAVVCLASVVFNKGFFDESNNST